MKIGQIELFVKDPLESKELYESVLGFEVVSVQGSDFVWARCGEVEILLRKGNPSASSTYESSNQAIVLYTEDLGATELELSTLDLQCQRMANSDNCLTFTDPDGYWYQLVNPNEL